MSFDQIQRRRVIIGLFAGVMFLPALIVCGLWGHILLTWLFPPARPVFSGDPFFGPDYRWGWPFDFQDSQKNVFFVDQDLNIVLVVLSDSPLIDVKHLGPVFMPRPHPIDLRNNDDRSISAKVDLDKDHCYFIGQDMQVNAVPMPDGNVARVLKEKVDRIVKNDLSVEMCVVEELKKLGVEQ